MPAMQQMLMASASAGAPAPPVVVSYIGATAVGLIVNTNTVTVSNVAIGPAASNRMVFQIVNWYNTTVAAALSSATIAGVAATIQVCNGSQSGGSGTFLGAAIISALVPTGTTATVVLNFAAGATSHSISLETYNVTGILSTTPIATISNNSNTVASYSGTINVQKDGLLLLSAMCYSSNTGYPVSGVTQDFAALLSSAGPPSWRCSGGSLAVSATQASRPVGVGATGGFSFSGTVVAASFR